MALGATPTIWKHTAAELVRLVAITAAVLVVIIAFASSVRWVASGALGPIEMIKFVALAIVPMLAYALPFAAGFGATMTFHRMATDNEVTAAQAGGVSHSSVLAPAIGVGLLLAVSLSLMNEQVIPRFLRNMEQLVSEDLTKVMASAIRNGDSLPLGDYIVTAQDVIRMDPSRNDIVAESGATDWLKMGSFMAVQRDDEGRIIGETTAREAQLFFFPHAAAGTQMGQDIAGASDATGRGSVLLLLFDAVAMSDGQLARFEKTRLPPIDVPLSFREDPKFLTFGELRRLRNDPDRMHFIESRRRNVATDLARQEIAVRVESALAREGALSFESPAGPVTIRGRSLFWLPEQRCWGVQPVDNNAPIEVLAPGPSGEDVLRRAESATLHMDTNAGPTGDGLALRIELQNVTTASTESLSSGDRRRLLYEDLTLPEDPLARYMAMSSRDLIAIDRAQNDGQLSHHGDILVKRLAKLDREITSKQHERTAMAVSCFVMVLCGAVVALRLRSALPLTVYLWSFFPALACVISISSGQQVVHDIGFAGLPILWGGVLGLAAYTLHAYRAVARH